MRVVQIAEFLPSPSSLTWLCQRFRRSRFRSTTHDRNSILTSSSKSARRSFSLCWTPRQKLKWRYLLFLFLQGNTFLFFHPLSSRECGWGKCVEHYSINNRICHVQCVMLWTFFRSFHLANKLSNPQSINNS